MYHNEAHFSDPFSFHPERWLNDPRFANDNRDAFQVRIPCFLLFIINPPNFQTKKKLRVKGKDVSYPMLSDRQIAVSKSLGTTLHHELFTHPFQSLNLMIANHRI